MAQIEKDSITAKVQEFVTTWHNLRTEYYNKNFPNNFQAPLKATMGKKYIKVVECDEQGRPASVMAFIDSATGDIYKAASWASPAKHARGNILSDKGGMEAVDGPYSIRYLR